MSHLLAFVVRARTATYAYIGGHPLSESYGRSQLRRMTSIIQDSPRKIVRDLGTKGDLTMYELRDIFTESFVLYDNAKRKAVAFAIVDELGYRPGYKSLNALYVDKAYRGQKLATVLHLGALHVHKKLMSDTTMAMGALNAFRSLEKHGYKIKMFDTRNRRPVPFVWGPDGIPEVDGQTIEESDDFALYV